MSTDFLAKHVQSRLLWFELALKVVERDGDTNPVDWSEPVKRFHNEIFALLFFDELDRNCEGNEGYIKVVELSDKLVRLAGKLLRRF